MHNSPVKTTARYLPGSPCYSQASEVAMEPEKKEDEENENKGEKENEENEDKEEEQEEEEQQPLEKPASKAKAGSKPKVPKTPPKTFKGKKPKPTAKAKGSAKDKKEKTQKEKKEKKNKKEDTPAPFKRPAAKGGTRDQVSKLQSGVPEAKEEVEKVEGEEEKQEEEEVREQDECVDPDGHNEKRSKGSGGKFNRLLKAGKVPAQIKEIWKNSETTEEKTMLVDCLLQEELQDRLLGNAQTIPASEAGWRPLTRALAKMPRPVFHVQSCSITTSMAMLMPSTRRWPVVTSQRSTKEGKWCTVLIYESGRAKNSDQRVEKYVRDICERYWRVSSGNRR